MKTRMLILGLLFTSLTSLAEEVLDKTISHTFCNEVGSKLELNFKSVLLVNLTKNGVIYPFYSTPDTLISGGDLDKSELTQLSRYKNLLSVNDYIIEYEEFSFSTLTSKKSKMKTYNTLVFAKASNDDIIAVLNSNGTSVFFGSKNFCK